MRTSVGLLFSTSFRDAASCSVLISASMREGLRRRRFFSDDSRGMASGVLGVGGGSDEHQPQETQRTQRNSDSAARRIFDIRGAGFKLL